MGIYSMKNIITLLVILIGHSNPYSQDLVTIKHKNYTTTFSKSLEYPVLVEWWETKAKDACDNPLPRKDQFQPDPQLPKETNLAKDYVGSGYDRGHMCPAASNLCGGDSVLTECFYFSNMSAQLHRLNAGDWKSLEVYTRNLAIEKDSIHVWCGNVGVIKKIGGVSVPKQCWKVIYIVKTKEYKAYLFNNDDSKPDGFENNLVPLKEIEKLTKHKFK
jgi:endonuclease G